MINLGQNKDLIIKKPDKGRGVIILDKTDYVSKLNSILSDTDKLKKCPDTSDIYSLSLKFEDKASRFIKKLNNLGIISLEQYNHLFSSSNGPGIMNGSPKIHKSNTPLRPILAAYNTASYKLSKFLVPLLEHLATNNYTVENSYQFQRCISNERLSLGAAMASFHIVSLFTIIPVNETINIILDKIYNHSELFNSMSKSIMKTFLQIAILDSFFYLIVKPTCRWMASPWIHLWDLPSRGDMLNNCPIAFKHVR